MTEVITHDSDAGVKPAVAAAASTNGESLKDVDFSKYKREIKLFAGVKDAASVDKIVSDLSEYADILGDAEIVAGIAKDNGIDVGILQGILQKIQKQEAKNISSTVVDNKGKIVPAATTQEVVVEPKVQTEEQKLQAVIDDLRGKLSDKDKELLGMKGKLDASEAEMTRLNPKIIRMELATNPLRIPKYLRMKMRDRMIQRKARDPYTLLYYMRSGQMRRFVSTKNRLKNGPHILTNLQSQYTKVLNNPKTPRYKQIEMKKRLAVLEQVAPKIQAIAPVKITF